MGTVKHLTAHLKSILKEENTRSVPEEAPMPTLVALSTKQLGTATVQVNGP